MMKTSKKYFSQALFILTSALAIPAAASIHMEAATECPSGGICAIVCSSGKAPGEFEVHYADFATLESNGHVHRDIIERLGSTPDEQIREHALQLSEADRYSSDLFDGAMEHVKRTSEFDDTTTLSMNSKSSCERQKLADYSPYKHAYVIDQKLYGKLNATDRAGLWTRLAFSHIVGETDGSAFSSKIPKLVAQIYYGSEEDYDHVKIFKTAHLTKSEKLEHIRELLKSVVPQTESEDTNTEVAEGEGS